MAANAQGMDAVGQVTSLRQSADALSTTLPALMLQANQIANTLSHGEHGRRRSGIGESFWQYRQYSPGDAANKIDWRQSAKSQSHFVRENEWQGAQSVWLWCDRSPSMNYCSAFATHTKQERALVLSLALAGLLMRGGERIELCNAADNRPHQDARHFHVWRKTWCFHRLVKMICRPCCRCRVLPDWFWWEIFCRHWKKLRSA